MAEAAGTTAKACLTIGVIGLGGMGVQHCKNIAAHVPDLKLAAVCDVDAAVAQKLGAEFGVPAFTSHQELIASGLCQAALVATPHPLHPPAALDCIGAGMHVLCEKPLSENIATAEKMVQAAKRRKVTLGVMFQMRFHPPCREALRLVREGEIGRILRATLIAPCYRSQAYYNAGRWRATWVGEGGGVLLNQAPHILDLFVNLVGLPESLRGTVSARLHDIEVEDLAEATLEFAGGGTGYVYCSTNEPGPPLTIEVFGDKGKLVYRDGQVRFWRITPPVTEFTRNNTEMWAQPKCEEVPLPVSSEATGHADVMRNFAAHILRGEELRCAGELGLGQLELSNAIILSGHTGKPVKLPISRRAYNRLLARLRATSKYKDKAVETKRITDPQFTR